MSNSLARVQLENIIKHRRHLYPATFAKCTRKSLPVAGSGTWQAIMAVRDYLVALIGVCRPRKMIFTVAIRLMLISILCRL